MDALRPEIMASEFAISAGHYLASHVGYEILCGGGNAVDAGVAAGLALGVVQSDLVNFAGVAPIMLWDANRGQVVSIDGLGVWPAAARIETFINEHGGQIPENLLRTVTPAAPSAWLTALARYGSLSFAEVATGALRLARDGFGVDPCMAQFIAAHADGFARWPQNRAVYLPQGRPPQVGELLVQADLAGTIAYMVDEADAAAGSREAGIEAAHTAFYKGDIAAAIADYHGREGGWLTREDLAGFRARLEPTVTTRFAGLEVHCCGAWSQGPALAELLGLMEGLDLAALGHNSLDYVHQLTEAMKLVFADREQHVADPDFFDAPIAALLAPGYLAARRTLIDPVHAWPHMPPPGDPRSGAAAMNVPETSRTGPPRVDPHATRAAPTLSLRDTSYVCVADRRGNVFSATPSDTACDSPLIPGTGICPSSRGSQGRADPAHPASVAPGKRPRLTPNPAMALEHGKPRLVFGTPGGDVQIQAMAQLLGNWRWFAMGVQQAIEAPRFATYSFPSSFAPNTYAPGLMALEGRIAAEGGAALERRGHQVERWPDFTRKAGALCAIEIEADTGRFRAGADPRRSAYALGR